MTKPVADESNQAVELPQAPAAGGSSGRASIRKLANSRATETPAPVESKRSPAPVVEEAPTQPAVAPAEVAAPVEAPVVEEAPSDSSS